MELSEMGEVEEILNQAISAVHRRDSDVLRELSDRAVNLASASEDQPILQTAVVIYALSKVLSRIGYAPAQREKALLYLEKMKSSVVDGKQYARALGGCLDFIAKMDKKFKVYVDYVLEMAQAKKGVTLHAQGLSVAKTAQLLGISQWELMKYIGKTRIHEQDEIMFSAKDRLRYARRLFL